jgi:hypothetical protein
MTTNFITRFFHCLGRTKTIQRFEFLLPTTYNDGTAIEPKKFDQTALELAHRFEGISQDLILVHGMWKFANTVYSDKLVRLRIDTQDRTARKLIKAHKPIWKERFKQLDLWITVHEIEII